MRKWLLKAIVVISISFMSLFGSIFMESSSIRPLKSLKLLKPLKPGSNNFFIAEDRFNLGRKNTKLYQVSRAGLNLFKQAMLPYALCDASFAVARDYIFFPAPMFSRDIEEQIHRETSRRNFLKGGESFSQSVSTPESWLDSFGFIRQEKQEAGEQKWLVHVEGNASYGENALQELKRLSDELGINVLSGNYRGVGESEGKVRTFKDLVVDTDALVQSLLARGVKPRNIILQGRSIGAYPALMVAARYQDKEHPEHSMNVSLVYPFSSLARAASSKLPLIGNVVGALFKWFSWEGDNVSALKKINGKVWVINSSKYDPVIGSASLGQAIDYKQLEREGLEVVELAPKPYEAFAKDRGFSEVEYEEAASKLLFSNVHNLALSTLANGVKCTKAKTENGSELFFGEMPGLSKESIEAQMNREELFGHHYKNYKRWISHALSL